MIKEEHIKEIEKLILFNKEAGINGYANLPQKEILPDYQQRVDCIDYQYFIGCADMHYFISRQLYLHFIGVYAYFCAHQCVENYLKGFIKFIGVTPPNSHILKELLIICKDKTKETDFQFIHCDNISTILDTYEPFYELARYPVQHVRPQSGRYAMIYPSGIEVLDYFVYRMRDFLPKNEKGWDIIKDGLPDLLLCKENRPDFYSEFKKNNINFE